MAIQKEALELVASFPARARDVGPGAGRGAAAHRRAARAGHRAAHAAVHDQLPEEHRRRVAPVALGVRPREGVRRGYSAALQARATRAPTTSAGARCCRGCWCASRTTRASTASSGCSATATGFRRNGANSTSSTNSRGCAAGSASSSCCGAGAFSHAGVSRRAGIPEDAAADAARLRQLHARPGRMGRAAARGLGAVADARAAARHAARASSSTSPARRGCAARTGRTAGGRVLFLDAGAGLRAHRRAHALAARAGRRIAEAGRAAGARAATAADAPRLAVRPRGDRARAARRALRHRRRRARRGRAAGADPRGRGDRAAARRRAHAGRRGELRRSHADGESDVNPESVARRIRGTTWRMDDRSDTGCRLLAPVKEAPAKLGEILAIREGDTWALAVVRRMQRQQVDEVTVGVEIIARRLVRVLLRNWVTPSAAARAGADRPFFGIYLPAHPRQPAVGAAQPDRARTTSSSPGGMVELDTGNARYLIRFTQTLERQPGWAWALFTAVRKLTPDDRTACPDRAGAPESCRALRRRRDRRRVAIRIESLATSKAPVRGDVGPPSASTVRQAWQLVRTVGSADIHPREEIQMQRRSFLKNTGLAGILAAGSAPAFAQARARGQVAPRLELSEEPRHDLRRRRDDLRSASRRRPTTSSRSRCSPAARSCRRSASSTPCRTPPSSAATPRRTTSSARTRRSRFGCAIPFGMNARQQNAWMYHGGGLRADARVPARTTTSSASRPATPARRWAAGSARRSRRSPTSRASSSASAAPAAWCSQKLGVVPQQIPGGDIYPALEKGTIDAAEWVGPYDDEKLGFYKVAKFYYYPGWWEGGPSSTSSSTPRRGPSCRRTTRRSSRRRAPRRTST